MKRQSIKQAPLETNVKVRAVYPMIDTIRVESLKDLKTIGIRFTPAQARVIGTNLLIASNNPNWEAIDLTGNRQTRQVTVTGETYE